ncbi:MAG: AzlC family ABC transporter permease [Candidatus Binatia bacterium]
MIYSTPFREGVKAAIPIWIAFVPFSFALGIAAKTHGLRLEEIVLMSALVYAGPAQFAALEPFGSGKPALYILLTTFLINLRFLPMSTALAPYFHRVRRVTLLASAQFISASSFVLSYLHFQKEALSISESLPEIIRESAGRNLHYFLGVSVTSFTVWVLGSGLGYWAALRVPPGFEEGLKFILPGYFACMLVMEMRGWTAPMICLVSLMAAVPASLLSPNWGWLLTALITATIGWGLEQWIQRVSQ